MEAAPTVAWFSLALVVVVGVGCLLLVAAALAFANRSRPARRVAKALPVARRVGPPANRAGSQLGFTPTGAILGGLLLLCGVLVGILAVVTGDVKLALKVGL